MVQLNHPIRILLVLSLLLALGPVAPVLAVTDAQVGQAIDQLVQFLYKQQNAQGHWDDAERGDGNHSEGLQYGGTSALVTYALLAAGESYQKPQMKRAINALANFDIKGTYATALRMHVWSHLPDSFEPALRKDLAYLLTCPIDSKTAPGAKAFGYGPGLDSWSNSRTQYGTLGLWEAAKRGMPVPQAVWTPLQSHFIATQLDSGAWIYNQQLHSTGTVAMTAAGLTAMYILQDYLHAEEFRTPGRADNHPIRKLIDRGLEFFSKNWKPTADSPGRGSQFLGYHLYGTERVGLASGRKYFGGLDWFAAGADVIVKNTSTKGFAVKGSSNYSSPVVRSAFALLFLSRGRSPIFASKLEIPGHDWNNRPRDLANLAAWVSDTVEQKMNWQVIAIDNPVEDWLDAPMLYLTGAEPLKLDDKQKAKLKSYIDLGGLLIVAADANSAQFVDSIEKLLAELYPRYPMQMIADDDELASIVFPIQPLRLGAKSIHNGARHLAIVLGGRDVPWTWHAQAHTDPAPWQFMINVYHYASEKGRIRNRLEDHVLRRNKTGGGPKITVGRARYEGNWDPEPRAWTVQADRMFNASKAQIATKEFDLAKLPSPKDVPFVHVCGSEDVQFSADELESIKTYVEAGGRMLFENVGGRGLFLEGVQQSLLRAFPNQRLRPVATDHPILSGQGIGGYDVASVRYRPFVVFRIGNIDSPRLLSIAFDGDPRILLSNDDLSFGLLDQRIWGIYGYTPDSAAKLMTNFVLASASQKPAEKPKPAKK